jgi:prepilin-type N-terminal cleavage/methylation domain-containing protein/prepilin-type processing-associated H-X9-DG protein
MNTTRRLLRGGFTLIELLVVMAIMGILGALLFPALTGGKKRTDQATCTSNMRQICIFINQYARDKEVFPDSSLWTGTTSVEDGPLGRYTKEGKIFACPADTDLKDALKRHSTRRLTSYAYNSWFDRKPFSTSVDMSRAVLLMEPRITGGGGTMQTSFQGSGAPRLTDRHSGGGLIAFGDAHVEFYTQQKFQKQKETIFEVTR